MIWFAPFQGLGDDEAVPRSSNRLNPVAPQTAGHGADAPGDDDQSRWSSASTSTTA